MGDTFYVVYAARSIGKEELAAGKLPDYRPNDQPTWTRNWRRGGILTTKDFKTATCLGPISGEDVFDANFVLFPEKVNGRYVMLHRPTRYEPSPVNCPRSSGRTSRSEGRPSQSRPPRGG